MIRIVVDLGQKRLDQSRTKPRLALVLDALPYLIKESHQSFILPLPHLKVWIKAPPPPPPT